MPDSRPGDQLRVARYLRDVAAFATCYILLDWASFIEPIGQFNITPWNPQPALAIVWMTLTGVFQWPVVFITLVLADVLVRGAPAGYAVSAGSAFTLAAGYATMALILNRGLRSPGLHSTRDFAFFTATIIVGAGIVGGAYVNVLAVAYLLPQNVSITAAWVRFWVGDAVGILVTGPLLFAIADNTRRASLRALFRDPQRWIEWAVLCAVLGLVFYGLPAKLIPRFFVVFLPIMWIAVRSGMSGAIVALVIVQLGVIVGLHDNPARHLSLTQIQLLVCVLGMTGLFIGVGIDERRRRQG